MQLLQQQQMLAEVLADNSSEEDEEEDEENLGQCDLTHHSQRQGYRPIHQASLAATSGDIITYTWLFLIWRREA